jgi:hypothetical protein
MSTLTPRTLSTLLALTALPLLAQVDKAELVKNPKYAEKDVKPVFKKLTAEEARAAVKVSSGRNSAMFGFNDSAVRIHLPQIDNSNWIDDEFSDPKLFDKKQKPVTFEKEQGIYDHDSWSTEIRFTSGGKKPVEFAKAVGSVKIKYPLVMRTRSFKKSESAKAKEAGVTFDGPIIKTDLSKVPESAFGSNLEGIRAYDKTGKRLERVMGYSASGWEDGVSFRGVAFHGDVARVDVDVVDEWTQLQIDYEMPPAPKLSESVQGTPSSKEAVDTPGAKYTVKIVPME